ncbi:hypothetical protein [Amycolatopsis sp. H20-H5]|uniref:hypothetical protein n=1 Tax=Amycolatopsis sp. H20-H5 TaxID=3046309 RepID=UPI002DBBE946|nr:hypothetical protein [Amycolatopsis sp. H20-H5]MEC3977676.1 hypothetical protein [Amycolatopsis sp. H20-H5]
MRRKTAGLTVAILSLLCLAAAPASASGGDQYPPGCFSQLYSIYFGQAIAVNCGDYPTEGYGYRVVAHCTSGSTFWFSYGTFVPFGFGPSVAECEGGLLTTAAVGGYHVIDN